MFSKRRVKKEKEKIITIRKKRTFITVSVQLIILSPPLVLIIGFCKHTVQTDHNESSHQGLPCLTVSLSTLHINFFLIDSLLKKKKKKNADNKCSVKFGAKVMETSKRYESEHQITLLNKYHNNHKYWYTLYTYHTCPKI